MILTLIFVILNLFGIGSIKFAFDLDDPKNYYGFLWKGTNRVHLSPRLQASHSVNGEKLCGLNIVEKQTDKLPFHIKLIDRQYGFADVLVNSNVTESFWGQKIVHFTIEAQGCTEDSSKSTDRATVTVQLIDRHGPIFDRPSYRFTISQQSPTGSVVGKVQAIEENLQPDAHIQDRAAVAICNYRLSPDSVPFTVDKYGIIRVRGQLPARRTSGPHTFQVTAEDCFRPVPRTASVDIFVEQTQQDCQPGWKGFPSGIEYEGGVDRSGKLFPPTQHINLETCSTVTCSKPSLLARLELMSALQDIKLETANPQACLHSPMYLKKQWAICGLHETTMTNLLPDPQKDLVSQMVAPNIGNPPRATVPTMSWFFNSAVASVWQIDPAHIGGGNSDTQNAFDGDFTLTFWIRRQPSRRSYPINAEAEDQEETVMCSQDADQPQWRFFSASFQGCYLIVRLLAALRPDEADVRQLSTWKFGPLPADICDEQPTWHHYAISFSKAPWPKTVQLVSLLVDGQDLGPVGVPYEAVVPVHPNYKPSAGLAKPRITVGGCFDPVNRWTRQHLDAELAGMTLLTGHTEAPNKLYCLAHCGEALLMPNLLQFLRSDITVNLLSGSVTITGNNAQHVAKLISEVAYSRPQAQISPHYKPDAVQSRLIRLNTEYTCPDDRQIAVPPVYIRLNVIPVSKADLSPEVAVSSKVSDSSHTGQSGASSFWVPVGQGSGENTDKQTVDLKKRVLEAVNENEDMDRPPPIIALGSDIIVVDPSTADTGIPLFPDIRFGLPEDVSNSAGTPSDESAASSIPVDNCLVYVKSSGDQNKPTPVPGLNAHLDERIEWPVSKVLRFSMTGKSDHNGVLLQGHHPAGDYAHLLQSFVYWPPKAFRGTAGMSSAKRHSEVLFVATVALVCTLEGGAQKTLPFYTKIIIQSPDNDGEQMQGDQPLPENSVYYSSDKDAHFSLSDRELRKPSSWNEGDIQLKLESMVESLGENQPDDYGDTSRRTSVGKGLVIGACVLGLLVLATLVAFVLIKKRSDSRHVPHSAGDRRRRLFASQPADFGGGSLKRDPVLQLVQNPFLETEKNLDEFGSMFSLAPQHCIYSPPMVRQSQRGNRIRKAQLAGLEEFNETSANWPLAAGAEVHGLEDSRSSNYASEAEGGDEFSEDRAEPDSPASQEAEVGEQRDLYNEEYAEWMDDDAIPEEHIYTTAAAAASATVATHQQQAAQGDLVRWDMVAETEVAKNGSPVVQL